MIFGISGNGEWKCRFTKDEQKTMITLWCVFRSPLMIGAELTKLDDWTLSLLTNEDLLALLGENCTGIQIVRTDDMAVWKSKNTKTGALNVALFNLGDTQETISVDLPILKEGLDSGKIYSLLELWDKTQTQTKSGRIEAEVPAHGVKVFRVEA